MNITYGPNDEQYFADGRPLFVDENGRALSIEGHMKAMQRRFHKRTWLTDGRERIFISTAFMGIDMNWTGVGRSDMMGLRWHSRREAAHGHKAVTLAVRRHIRQRRATSKAARASLRRMRSSYRTAWS